MNHSFYGAVHVQQPIVRSGKNVWLQIHNSCEADIQLARAGGNGPAGMTLPAHTTVLVEISTAAADTPLDLQYTATNFLMAPETGLPVVLNHRALAIAGDL